MVQYKFFLTVPNNPGNFNYTIDLNSQQENEPKNFFTPTQQEKMRQDLQNQSGCKIRDNHLETMIARWVEDIEEGFRASSITLKLPSQSAEDLQNLQESGNQEKPVLIEPNLAIIEPKGGAFPPL